MFHTKKLREMSDLHESFVEMPINQHSDDLRS